jgi:outer membrane protein assembly factor BamB
VIVDKTNVDEVMAGYPLAQVRRADGGVFTLYRGTEHPFIHALNSVEGWALCLDLPAVNADDATAARDWGLAASPDGGRLYAANATLGLVEQIDPANYEVSRQAQVKPLAGSGIVLAKFGHEESGPTGRRVVIDPDGTTIYAAGSGGILAISAADLSVRARFETGAAVDALAVTPGGGTVFALLADGHIVKLDATTGQLESTVPGDDYDRLVAVVPW